MKSASVLPVLLVLALPLVPAHALEKSSDRNVHFGETHLKRRVRHLDTSL